MKAAKKEKKIRLIPLAEFEKRFTKEELEEITLYQKYFEALSELRTERKKQGLSQSELSQKSGIPQETISRIESGRRNANIETLMALAIAMGKKLRVELI